jgi:hypothetical protein
MEGKGERRNHRYFYGGVFENPVRPRRDIEFVQSVRTMAAEEWRDAMPHSGQIKSLARNLMHTIVPAYVFANSRAGSGGRLISRISLSEFSGAAKRVKATRPSPTICNLSNIAQTFVHADIRLFRSGRSDLTGISH